MKIGTVDVTWTIKPGRNFMAGNNIDPWSVSSVITERNTAKHSAFTNFASTVLSCRQSTPHYDDGWRGQFFLGILLAGMSELGDSEHVKKRDSILIQPGDVYVIDPMVAHWAIYPNWIRSKKKKGYLGITFDISKKKLGEVKEIVNGMTGFRLSEERLARDSMAEKVYKYLERCGFKKHLE